MTVVPHRCSIIVLGTVPVCRRPCQERGNVQEVDESSDMDRSTCSRRPQRESSAGG